MGCEFLEGGNAYRPTRSLQDFVRAQFRAGASETEAVNRLLDTGNLA